MCNFKSGIILKDRVYIPSHDSHQKMLEELGIEDTRENAERVFVRAELVPANGDKFSEPDAWSFKVDQDIIPEWFVEEFDKQRTIEGVKEWMKGHVFAGENNIKLEVKGNSKEVYYFKDCKGIEIKICDTSSAEVVTRDTSSAKVVTCDTSFVYNTGCNPVKFSVLDNSVFKDNSTKTIYYTAGWKAEQVTE